MNEDAATVAIRDDHRPEVIQPEDARPAVGQWFWVRSDSVVQDENPWLGCVTHVGSNFAQLSGAGSDQWVARIHFDEWADRCTPEPDAEKYIARQIDKHRAEAHRLMGEVKALTSKLAIPLAGALSEGSETEALALRGTVGLPIEDYKKALVLAKEESLPSLFKAIREANEQMGAWMNAELIPLRAEADALRPAIKAIEGRIFNVELYAGLIEEVEQIADGEPAPRETPVHLHQRRCYMDEECLARYQAGGMQFEHIEDFDAWLAAPENRDRILPHPRCVVAFRVRRNMKDIDSPSLSAYIRMMEDRKLDKLTFLYLRNGERLYRLSTGIEFGPTLFPDLAQIGLVEGEVYARMFAGRVDTDRGLISKAEFEARVAKEEEQKRIADAAPKEDRWRLWPHTDTRREFEPFNPGSVYYDDIAAYVKSEMDRHNRLVLVLQGLFDRAPVFHPHPPWQLWTPEGFEAALRLVYDESRTLTPGDKPDFEAYRVRLNASLKTGCITVGQDDYWQELEAEKESRRRDRDWREKGDWRPKRWQPYGDPGPGILARVARFSPRAKKATFEWWKPRASEAWRYLGDPAEVPPRDRVPRTLVVPAKHLLNVSAYRQGDFRQFFDDPRTRAEYLHWAPLLLEAEEFLAGHRKIRNEE